MCPGVRCRANLSVGMTHELRFDLNEVRAQLDHADRAPSTNGIYGEPPTGPSLWWVKDDGTYIMSNGVVPEGTVRPKVAYAEGLGEDADWDLVAEVCGGDDFCEDLGPDVAAIIRDCPAGDGALIIRILPGDEIEVEVTVD